MKLRDTMIAWKPDHSRRALADPQVKVGPHPSDGWQRGYLFTDGACWLRLAGQGDKGWRDVSADERLLRLFVMFTIMTIRDGIPPAEVHRAFLGIDEYREALPSDVPTQAGTAS